MNRRSFIAAAGSAGVCGLLPSVEGSPIESVVPKRSLTSDQEHMIRLVREEAIGERESSLPWTKNHWWKEISFPYLCSSDPDDYDYYGVASSLWKGEVLHTIITWYLWPQDRCPVLETIRVAGTTRKKPRFKGDVSTLWVPTFDLRMERTHPKSQSHIFLRIAHALRLTTDHKYCAVFEIEGVEDEFGICCTGTPAQPVINNWKNRDLETEAKLVKRRKNDEREAWHNFLGFRC